MIENITARFFTYAFDDESEIDIVECTESDFRALAEKCHAITYERHSVFQNGVRQICITVEPINYPSTYELEAIK